MKKIFLILLTAIMMLSAVACQATPDEVVVVQKDTDRLIEQASSEENGDKVTDLGIPEEHYVFNSELSDGRLKINVDADISIPEADKIPIRKVSIGAFSQETVTGIFQYLFDGDPAYDMNQARMTKSDYEKLILNSRQKLADKSYLENDQSEQDILNLIANMEELYKNAPETLSEPSLSDGTMTIGLNPKGLPSESSASLQVQTQDGSKRLSIYTPASAEVKDLKTSSGQNKLNYRVASPAYTTKGMLRIDGSALPEDANDKLTITFEEAQALCDGFFGAAGMQDDFCVGAAYLVDDKGDGLTDGTWENGKYVADTKESADNYAYQFYYTRKTDNVPVATIMEMLSAVNAGFNIKWDYEYICIIVDNSGIVSIDWFNPVTIGEIVQEDVTMLPFDKVITIFENMVKVTYEPLISTHFDEEGSLEINANNVELRLLRVREQNGDGTTGLLIPAWVFYGHSIGVDSNGVATYDLSPQASGYLTPQAPVILLAINAIDGSIIDLEKGY